MRPRPPRSTRTYTLFPYTTLSRSVGSLILAFVTSPPLAILFVILVPVVAVTIVWVFNRSYPLFASVQRSLDRVNTVMQENRSEEHTSELQSLMRISYAVFCLKKKITK